MRSSTLSSPSSALLAAALVVAASVVACGSDSDSDDGFSSGATGATAGGSSGTGGSSSSTGGSAGKASGGTTASAGAGASSGGSSGSSTTSGGTSSSGGTASSAAGAAGQSGIPSPTEDGTSVYAVECHGDTADCNDANAHCLGIHLESGDGFTCSNHCDTVADCSDAPSGAEAQAGCVQFTQESRCVLVCASNGNEYACPAGMDCYVYPNSFIGYCLWM